MTKNNEYRLVCLLEGRQKQNQFALWCFCVYSFIDALFYYSFCATIFEYFTHYIFVFPSLILYLVYCTVSKLSLFRGGMFPGCCHFYAIFYFGFSEISTAILCLLANFDPKYGIAGLDEAFPKTKLILGGLFVLSFVVCRLILWPYATYFFARDTMRAMKSNVPRVHGRRGYLRIIYCCCVFLTLIQLLFVAMIIQTGKEEIGKLLKN